MGTRLLEEGPLSVKGRSAHRCCAPSTGGRVRVRARRQASEQVVISCQQRSHFFLHTKGRAQTTQICSVNLLLLRRARPIDSEGAAAVARESGHRPSVAVAVPHHVPRSYSARPLRCPCVRRLPRWARHPERRRADKGCTCTRARHRSERFRLCGGHRRSPRKFGRFGRRWQRECDACRFRCTGRTARTPSHTPRGRNGTAQGVDDGRFYRPAGRASPREHCP